MAAMKCPDCGGQVSSEAPACPSCGWPVPTDPSKRPGWWLGQDGRWYPPHAPAATNAPAWVTSWALGGIALVLVAVVFLWAYVYIGH